MQYSVQGLSAQALRGSSKHSNAMRREIHALAAGLGLLLSASVQANQYTVRWERSTQLMQVTWCGTVGTTLRSFNESLTQRTTLGDGQPVESARIRTSTRCLNYRVDMQPLVKKSDFRSGAYLTDNTLLTRSDQWLWRPLNQALEVTFEHSANERVSSPWVLLERQSDRTRYRRPVGRSGANRIAIGPLSPIKLPAPFTSVRAIALAPLTERQTNTLTDWLYNGLASSQAVFGWLPDTQPQVMLISTEANDAVQFGQVLRSGGNSVHFFLNPDAPAEAWRDDWTATHEFVHLLHPYLGGDGRWLAEGLASYYQYIAQGRAGHLSPAQVFERLAAGFQRGRDNLDASLSFAQASAEVARFGQYRRIYWSGAAVIFMIDTQLMDQSNGELDVATVLGRFAKCCLRDQPRMSADALLQALDRLSGTTLFTSQFERWLPSHSFPDVTAAWASLGVHVDSDNQVVLLPATRSRQALLHLPSSAGTSASD